MGTHVPEEPFEIDPTKNYKVTVDHWTPHPEPAQCGINYQGQCWCFKTGAEIIAWVDAGSECTFDILCSPVLAGFCDRIYSLEEV